MAALFARFAANTLGLLGYVLALRPARIRLAFFIQTSVHSAKGLEWRFVIGMDATQKHLRRDSDIEEERRLFYVETTRAKDRLVYTVPKTGYYGRETERIMFLNESRDVSEAYDFDDSDESTEPAGYGYPRPRLFG